MGAVGKSGKHYMNPHVMKDVGDGPESADANPVQETGGTDSRPVREIRIERATGGHIVHVHRVEKKDKDGTAGTVPSYEEPEKHIHKTKEEAHAHVGELMGNMPEPG